MSTSNHESEESKNETAKEKVSAQNELSYSLLIDVNEEDKRKCGVADDHSDHQVVELSKEATSSNMCKSSEEYH